MAPKLRKVLGPSIVMLGLAIGSGELILWPYLTSHHGMVIFWAAIAGVLTQYFLNMEIERYTLLTGESTITGFCRLSPFWAYFFLVGNVVGWAWPGWAKGGGDILAHLAGGSSSIYAAAGLLISALLLTLGPVVSKTLEWSQTILVVLILVILAVLTAVSFDMGALVEVAKGAISIGVIPKGVDKTVLLGALAFAGAGGTGNLMQSHYIRDKGYGMSAYASRLTSPFTGQSQPISSTGFTFRPTPENLARFRAWWKLASLEHAVTFAGGCILTLVLLVLLARSVFQGAPIEVQGFAFLFEEARIIGENWGSVFRLIFLVAGLAILFTTELAVLDLCARISTDIMKVNWLRDSTRWTEARIYFTFLWAEALLGCLILALGIREPFKLLTNSAAMHGCMMGIYTVILLYLNAFRLDRRVRPGPIALAALVWAAGFYGYFALSLLF